jgi:hypothetical protein
MSHIIHDLLTRKYKEMKQSTNIHAKWLWNPMSHIISKLEIHPNKVNESSHDIYQLEIHT